MKQQKPLILAILSTFPLLSFAWDNNEAINAPLTEAEIYELNYKGIVIGQNGLPSEIEGKTYVEIAIGNDIFSENEYSRKKTYFDGILPGLPYGWVQGGITNAQDVPAQANGFTIKCGSKLENGIDEGELEIWESIVLRNSDGTYSILPTKYYENNINLWESTVYFIYNPEENNYVSNQYAAFIKIGEQQYQAWNNFMVTEATLTPTGQMTYFPPKGAKEMNMQITSKTLQGVYEDKTDPLFLQGKIFNAALTEEAFYITGLFGDSQNEWLKGEIEGDNIVFKKGSPLGRTGLNLGVYDVAVTYENGSYNASLTPVDNDLIFAFDSFTNELYGCKNAFTLASDIEEPKMMDNIYPAYSYNPAIQEWFDIHVSAEIIPWEDVPMTPQQPYDVKCYEGSNSLPGIEFYISNISEEGLVMNPDMLFYHLVLNGETYSFPEGWFGTDFDTEIPYGFYTTPYWTGNGRPTLFLNGFYRNIVMYRYNSDFQVELVYYGGDEANSNISGDSTGIENIIPEGAITCQNRDVYDIFGRKVNPDNLTPGIYISNGKKFMVK